VSKRRERMRRVMRECSRLNREREEGEEEIEFAEAWRHLRREPIDGEIIVVDEPLVNQPE
jgi:hypothetical protein